VATKIAKQLAVAKAAHNQSTATFTLLHFFTKAISNQWYQPTTSNRQHKQVVTTNVAPNQSVVTKIEKETGSNSNSSNIHGIGTALS